MPRDTNDMMLHFSRLSMLRARSTDLLIEGGQPTSNTLLPEANAALARAIFPGVTVFVNIRRLGDLVTDVGESR